MGEYSQKNRRMQFRCAGLGEDELLLQSIRGTEGMSRLFDFELELLRETESEQEGGELEIVSQKATLMLGGRRLDGMLASVTREYWTEQFYMYRVRFVPTLWQLTLHRDCRIFERRSVIEIIKEVVTGYGIRFADKTRPGGDASFSGPGSDEGAATVLDYCTQYNETDFNFVSRLAERWGLYYFFEQATDGTQETVVTFGDSVDGYLAPWGATLHYLPYLNEDEAREKSRLLDEFRSTTVMAPGRFSRRDYSYASSSQWNTELNSANPLIKKNGGDNAYGYFSYSNRGFSSRKIFPYQSNEPGKENHKESFLSSKLLTVEKAASDAGINLYYGKTRNAYLSVGEVYQVEKGLVEDGPLDANLKMLLLEAQHQGTQSPPYTNETGENSAAYELSFTGMDSRIVFVPPALTPEPVIAGPQSALVLADEGEEITVDERGRVRIRFIWQRNEEDGTPAQKTDTAWVRVAQQWAGLHRGTMFWPRKDDEVLVQFIQGDPDDPVIVGSVYNNNAEPYRLPNLRPLSSGIVGRSVPYTEGDDHNNVFGMNDTAGQETLSLQAKRNLQTIVWNDSLRTIAGNEIAQIEKNQSTTVKQAQSLSVGGPQTVTVGGVQKTSVRSDCERTVCGELKELINGRANVTYKAGLFEKVLDDCTRLVTGSVDEKLGSYDLVTQGMIQQKSGDVIYLEAAHGICLKVGGNYIQIDDTGIQIQGTTVLINTPGRSIPYNASLTVTDPDLPAAKCGQPEEAFESGSNTDPAVAPMPGGTGNSGQSMKI